MSLPAKNTLMNLHLDILNNHRKRVGRTGFENVLFCFIPDCVVPNTIAEVVARGCEPLNECCRVWRRSALQNFSISKSGIQNQSYMVSTHIFWNIFEYYPRTVRIFVILNIKKNTPNDVHVPLHILLKKLSSGLTAVLINKSIVKRIRCQANRPQNPLHDITSSVSPVAGVRILESKGIFLTTLTGEGSRSYHCLSTEGHFGMSHEIQINPPCKCRGYKRSRANGFNALKPSRLLKLRCRNVSLAWDK